MASGWNNTDAIKEGVNSSLVSNPVPVGSTIYDNTHCTRQALIKTHANDRRNN